MDERLLAEVLLVLIAAAGFVGAFYGYRNGVWDGVKWAVEGEGYPSKPGPRWWAWRQLRAIVADDPRLRWSRRYPGSHFEGCPALDGDRCECGQWARAKPAHISTGEGDG